MNPIPTAALTGLIVISSRWAKKKSLSPKDAVAAVFLALFLTIVKNANANFSSMLSYLILVGVLLAPFNSTEDTNLTSILKGVGLVK